ncbi:MAG: FtsX-like permease family protein, partial [Woeseia sp.]|nr:FtsX-like permease family protein [Woeseia sp.]
APNYVLNDLAAIDGVTAVASRVVGGALINLDNTLVPIRAQAVSLPDFAAPRLNDLYLSSGRRIDPSRKDEILLLEGFAVAHDLKLGDSLSATMNGARRRFEIVGFAQAPEYLYSAAPGELAPDDARFAVIWMSEDALRAAYDLDGAFNQALLGLGRGSDLPAVLDSVDRILADYGGIGAFGLEDQLSNRFITEEIDGLKASSRSVPPVFLAVAAFLLYIVISRMVQSEREQIGLLKAFGYTSSEVGMHYFKFVLVIAIAGALLGCILGVMAGRSLAGFYQIYYKFPFLVFRVDPATFLTGFFVSVLSASAGGLVVLRKVFGMVPAEAMRPPAPADYSRSASLGRALKRVLDQPGRMVIRRIVRQPGRAAVAVIGIGAGMSLSVAMLSVMASFDQILELNFSVMDRSDVTVSFIEPLSDKTLFELRSLAGVIDVEPFRSVPAILRNGRNTYRGAINGLVSEPQLNRAVDDAMRPILIRSDGIILAESLAKILNINPGELLTVEVREGRRPVLEIPVVGISESLLGSPAYFELAALNRALREPHRVSGAFLRIDTDQSDTIYQAIKDMPAVAGVSLRSEARAAFQRLMNTGAGAIRFVLAAIAGIITFGIIYNSARIAFSERARDLASLRVIGFTKAEAAFVLLGELGVITLLALPVGMIFGYYLSLLISAGFSTDIYQIPAYIVPESYALGTIAVIAAATISGWLVKRDVDRLDLVSTLKTRD